MKIRSMAVGALLGFFGGTATAEVPHLELDLTGAEYRQIMERGLGGVQVPMALAEPDNLQEVLDGGKRLLDWLEKLNAARPDNRRLELSTPATQRDYPINQPNEYNRNLVRAQWNEVTAKLPRSMAEALLGTGELPATLDLDDETFLAYARDVDRTYQAASRWLLLEPYIDFLAVRSIDDLRGFYHLGREPELVAKLKAWKTLSHEDQARLSPWLIGLCHNGGDSGTTCEDSLRDAANRDGGVSDYYEKYLPSGRRRWNAHFLIEISRSDVDWRAAEPDVMKVPFRTPDDQKVKAWLVDNIEDEWRLGAWQLRLDFHDQGGDDMTHIKFEAGATPHVNGLAGNVITTDGNRSIREYTARWTIRHEYGHVLGFPDCYVEFYDKESARMINYQLDVTNLMCSRTGHLQSQLVTELRRVYFKN